jgi:O-antigen/teichoic acid export membrane protein
MQTLPSDRVETPAPADGLRTDSLVHGVVLLMALVAVQRMIGFLRSIFFCRWLEPEQLGLWDMAFRFLMLAGPLAVLALPGVFGRYVEYYRQRKQLRFFLRRTLLACFVMATGAAVLIGWNRQGFSMLIFDNPDEAELVFLIAGCLIAVVAFNYCSSMFMAMKNIRMVSAMEFINGVTFALLGLGLLACWKCDASSVVLAYGGSCSLCVALAAWKLRTAWKTLPENVEPLPHRALWGKLIPFAGWILVINLLTNLYGIAGQYLIVHCHPGSNAEALSMVGQYASAQVVPLLLISITAMLSSMLLPHLTHDWEAGRLDLVSKRINFFLKLTALGTTAAAAGVLFIAPWLFGTAFQGKYADGLTVLPWTLACCTWFGAAMIVQQYLCCAERVGLVGLALAAGLIVDIVLILILLPRMGLQGVVVSVLVANLVSLAAILYFARLLGYRTDRGLWVVLGAAPVVCLGAWIALALLLLIGIASFRTDRIFSAEEKRQMLDGLQHYRRQFTRWMGKWAVQN